MKVQILGITLGAASCFSCSVDRRALDIAPVSETPAPVGEAADASADAGGSAKQTPGRGRADGGDGGAGGGAGAGGSGGALGRDAAVDTATGGLQDCTACDPLPLASLTNGAALALGSPLLYFVDRVPSDAGPASMTPLLRLSTNGGTPAPVTLSACDVQLDELLVDGAYVYSRQYTVARAPILGGYDFSPISGAPNYVQRIRTNSTHVFALWGLSQEYVSRIPKEGGTENRPATTPLFDFIDFDVDEVSVYVATASAVSSVPVAGTGEGTSVLAAADPGESFLGVGVAGAQLVLASDQRIATLSKSGGTPATLSPGAISAFTTDGVNAYYFRANPGGGSTCSTGSELYGQALGGGLARHLASDHGSCVSHVVQDASGVYWLSGDGRTLYKASL